MIATQSSSLYNVSNQQMARKFTYGFLGAVFSIIVGFAVLGKTIEGSSFQVGSLLFFGLMSVGVASGVRFGDFLNNRFQQHPLSKEKDGRISMWFTRVVLIVFLIALVISALGCIGFHLTSYCGLVQSFQRNPPIWYP